MIQLLSDEISQYSALVTGKNFGFTIRVFSLTQQTEQ